MIGLQVEKAHCPYCGEPIELVIDCSVPAQDYIEDCQVCCRPIEIHAETTPDADVTLSLRTQYD